MLLTATTTKGLNSHYSPFQKMKKEEKVGKMKKEEKEGKMNNRREL